MSSPAEMTTPRKVLAVFGKSGTGKSSLCNWIAGKNLFHVGHGLQPCTTEKHEENCVRKTSVQGMDITVLDTPAELPKMRACAKQLRKRARKQSLQVYIIFCIRCDTRYAAEEHSTYKSIRKAWKNKADFCQRLIIAFTHGEELCNDNDADTEGLQAKSAANFHGRSEASAGEHDTNLGINSDTEEKMIKLLQEAWPPLKKVINNANNRHIIFKDKKSGGKGDDQGKAFSKLIGYVKETNVSSQACVIL